MNGILGDVLEIIGCFDWLSPIYILIRRLLTRDTAIILAGRYGVEVDHYLRRHGIKTWGWAYVNRQTLFHVKPQQERWARYLLRRKSYPVI